jgi:tetratricopeptide (TPR) repeat protein
VKNRLTTVSTLVLMLLVLTATNVSAIGSDEKTPEEKAAEATQQATEKYNNGVKHMDKARLIAEKGDSAYAFNYRATSDAKAAKEYDKAIKDFRTALKSDPNMIEAHNNLGYCYRKIGEFEKSLAAYSAALALDSTYAQAREYRGELFLAMDDLEEALAERTFLQKIESPYADTLSASIEFYRLQQIEKKMGE